ncbi:AtpZ/AtpI family protein [Dyadobacter sp. CY343]|uniref:AtpZ/AtpI family protein n=1 Tax=Dyadobacter sp. CY343 TaxID=2907299 RepID=UPI001F233B0D|nr:AtpZ/AtpI family protein [Dyadobacter sp. CY343]MCE7059024.1 AtpZ/AtpI family protein [Dyadobacter sp. CY343]
MDSESTGNGKENGKLLVKNQSSKFLKYSGLATQMLGTILLFTYGGYWLDNHQQNGVPVWTLILSLTSIAGSLYMLIRSFSKP